MTGSWPLDPIGRVDFTFLGAFVDTEWSSRVDDVHTQWPYQLDCQGVQLRLNGAALDSLADAVADLQEARDAA